MDGVFAAQQLDGGDGVAVVDGVGQLGRGVGGQPQFFKRDLFEVALPRVAQIAVAVVQHQRAVLVAAFQRELTGFGENDLVFAVIADFAQEQVV